MAEGGFFPWKRQQIDEHRGPAATYSNLKNPLPPPPKGKRWIQDEKTKEWSLETDKVTVAEAVLADDKDSTSFLEHTIQPSDTFQGICLRYKITPTDLRRANCFSGSNLVLAPNPLRIPSNDGIVIQATEIFENKVLSKEDQIRNLLNQCGGRLARSEAKCYLELSDWDEKEALKNAREDLFLEGNN